MGLEITSKPLFLGALTLGLLLSACAGPPGRGRVVAGPTSGPTPATSPDPPAMPEQPRAPKPRWPKPPEAPRIKVPHPRPSETGAPQPPSPAIPASLLGTQWYTLPTTEKVVALTFDAGANAEALPSILVTLDSYDVPATFFLTGRWVEAYPDHAAEIGARYLVANHTYSHPDLTKLSDQEVRSEILDGGQRIEAATGQDTRPLFRFPFGAGDARTTGVANSLGYGCINWTVDTRGWQGTSGGQSTELIVDRVMAGLRPGHIVIMHVGSHPTDGSTLDADALPRLIEEIQARGYRFVRLDKYL